MVALGGEGGKAFQFAEVGDGFDDAEVLEVTMKQDTDMDDGEPKVFYKKKPTKVSEVPKELLATCDPVPSLWVTVKTAYRNHEGLDKPMEGGDDGTRQVVLAGHKLIETKKVTRDVSVGGRLSVRRTGTGDPPKKGFNPQKKFDGGIKYTPPPAASVNLDSKPEASTAQHGPKPDYLPQDAWDAMPIDKRAALGPF